MGKRQRKIQGLERTAELKRLASACGYEVKQFTQIHFRVIGRSTVDYWPTTGKAWKTFTRDRGKKMTPAEVIAVAAEAMELLPEGAAEHMGAL